VSHSHWHRGLVGFHSFRLILLPPMLLSPRVTESPCPMDFTPPSPALPSVSPRLRVPVSSDGALLNTPLLLSQAPTPVSLCSLFPFGLLVRRSFSEGGWTLDSGLSFPLHQQRPRFRPQPIHPPGLSTHEVSLGKIPNKLLHPLAKGPTHLLAQGLDLRSMAIQFQCQDRPSESPFRIRGRNNRWLYRGVQPFP